MKNKSLLRKLGIAVVALVAIGAVGYAAGGGSSGTASDEVATTGSAPSVPGMAFPGEALGGGAGVGADGANIAKDMDDAQEESSRQGVAASAPDAGPLPSVGALASTVDRQIVSTASIQMQVDDVGGSFEEVGRLASSVGGFIASSSFSYRGEDQIASVTIRVPSESYQGVLASLRGLGVKVDSENSEAYDVTEEYTDLGARLRTLEATEGQLLTLLARAETISDILTVQDRLNYTRTEIEQVKGRMQLLDDLTSLATITVHLQPVIAANANTEPGEGVDLGAEVSEAWDESMEFLGEIAAGVVTVVVFAWWVPLIGVPVLLGYKAMSRHRPQAVD